MKRLILITLLLVAFFATAAEAVTLSQEIARVREYLYQTDSSNSTYTDTQITEAINQGQDLLTNLLSASSNLENVVYLNNYFSITGEATLSLSSSTVAVGLKRLISLSIEWPGTTQFVPAIQIKPEEFPSRYYKGTIKDPVFFIANNTISIYPGNPGGFEIVMCVYIKGYTALVNTSDTVTVQTRYLNFLTLAAVWYMLQTDNQQARAANVYKLLSDLITIENTANVNTNVIERVSNGGTK